jgi:opacity protein-like surface antigen
MKRVLFLTTVFLISALAAAAQTFSERPLFATNLPAESASASALAPSEPVADLRPAPQNQQGSGTEKSGGNGGVVSAVTRQPIELDYFGGYTFTRFYEVPGSSVDGNGFNFGLNIYPSNGWIGGDGEFMVTFATVNNQPSKFLLGMGGPKVRWRIPHEPLIVWAHGLAGEAHFSPQTSYGKEDAIGYEVGGGVDYRVSAHLAFRAEADMVGTRFFDTTQYSPKIGVGVVLKF